MKKICYFDLETKYAFAEIENGWESLTFDQKEAKRRTLIPKLGLATGCVIPEDKSSEALYFDEGQEKELIKILDSFDIIIGHNVLRFDYLVLSPHYKSDIIKHFEPKTFDTFDYLKDATGRFVKLDDLAKLNLNSEKTMDGAKAPQLWRSGKKEEVRRYCKNDVELLRKIYLLGQKQKFLKYKDYDTVREIKVSW
jgi:DNA polymerase III epsilon subunit-like protein